jgi:hypothetical protein
VQYWHHILMTRYAVFKPTISHNTVSNFPFFYLLSLFCQTREPIWKSFIDNLNEYATESSHVHLLWFHSSLKNALMNHDSEGVQVLVNMLLASSPNSFKLPTLATEVTYREIESSLEGLSSTPDWLIRLLTQLIHIAVAPATATAAPAYNENDDNVDVHSPAAIELIESSRCSACRLVCLLVDKAVKDPSGNISKAFMQTLRPVTSSLEAKEDESGYSFLYSSKERISSSSIDTTSLVDDSRATLFQSLDEAVQDVLQANVSIFPAQQARRQTLLNEVMPSLYSTTNLPEIWADHSLRVKVVWDKLQNVASLPSSDRGVGDLNACLGAACLLVDGADVSMNDSSQLNKYSLPPAALWSLISLGLESNMPLERRRATHLLRTVVLMATTDTTKSTKQPHQQANKKKSSQANTTAKTRVKHGNEWLAFLKAFEICDNEFQLHLVEQVWPLLRNLCNGALVEADVETGWSDQAASPSTEGGPFWRYPLPPMSYGVVRLLIGRSLKNENPAVVKFGLEKLFKGETCSFNGKNPAALFPPSWIRGTLIHEVLDDAKLVNIYTHMYTYMYILTHTHTHTQKGWGYATHQWHNVY